MERIGNVTEKILASRDQKRKALIARMDRVRAASNAVYKRRRRAIGIPDDPSKVLALVAEQSYAAAARQLGITRCQIAGYVHRARKQLEARS